MSSWQGPPVLVGERTLWLGSGSGLPKPGVVRWIGRLPEIGPDWTVGLELDEALPFGGIDGSWGGRVLFDCQPKHGLLVPISSVIPGSKLKHIPHKPGFEKKKNEQEKNSVVSLPAKQFEAKPTEEKTQPVINVPKPAVRQKRRIPTPPSSDTDEPSGPIVLSQVNSTDTTLRVEERDQEDSLKKRLRLFTENNGAVQRMKSYNECAFEEVVIDSLYAQRRQQFVKHGRSQSDSSRTFVSSASSPGSRRDRSSSAIFSIFRWFRRESRSEDIDPEFAPSAPPSPQLIRGHSTSCGSVDTLFSTATANSFAFVHPAYYRPFGAANPPEKCIIPGPETETYRNRLRQRDRIRELDRNLTLKKKYHLFGSGTLHRSVDDVNNRHLFLNKSLDSLKVNNVSENSKNSTLGRKKRKAPPPPVSPEEKSKALELPAAAEQNKENTNSNSIPETSPANGVVVRRHRRTVSDSAKDRKSGAFVHVRGKRKAPPPPVVNNNKEEKSSGQEVLGTQSLGRKKRHAPPPPLVIDRKEGENNTGSQGKLSPEEKQRLIDNINKLQAHADRKSLLVATPPASPVMNTKVSHTVYNDSLKLERGVLKANKSEIQSSETKPVTPTTPTPVSPRPWYKRNAGNKERSLEKRKEKSSVDDWMPEVAIVRKNAINSETNSSSSASSSSTGNGYRLSSIFSRFDKPEEKRKSQISMLANISELDREAAEIVQREQEREKAILAAQDAKYYTNSTNFVENNENDLEILHIDNKVPKNPESPKRSGARELISLFNAIGNVTKVTVHSAFFSKDGPSIFSKEGVEKRFSMTGEAVNTSGEKVIKESFIETNGYKRETVFIETKESFSESPGIKRRKNLAHQKSDDSGSSASSGAASPRVVIEEIDDTDKSKTQALYEANKIRKHHSPSPSIPTIAEMSESISSVTASPGSTINASERSVSITPTPTVPEPAGSVRKVPEGTNTSEPNQNVVTPKHKPSESTNKISAEPGIKQPQKNYSIWSCPRCTLENPRWRVTCEACDMWRPAVRRDVIDKLTNANMGSTIAVNLVKAGDPKSTSSINQLSSQAESSASAASAGPSETKTQQSVNPNGTSTTSNDVPKNTTEVKSPPSFVQPAAASKGSVNAGKVEPKALQPQNTSVKNSLSLSGDSGGAKSSVLKPITVSGLLNGSCYDPKQSKITEIKDITDIKINSGPSTKNQETENISVGSRVSSSARLQKEVAVKQNLPADSSLSVLQKSNKPKEISSTAFGSSGAEAASSTASQSESDMEEVRKARLAFFEKSQSDSKTNDRVNKEPSAGSSSISQAKIDALFSIASKGSLATNEEERLKVKEILKEMKNSLPKKSRENKLEAGPSKMKKTVVNIAEKENISNISSSTSSSDEAARLGAIKKSKAQTSLLPLGPKDLSARGTDNKQQNKTAEVYLIKSETVIEEIKVKDNSKSPKVSTSVQTSGVVRKVEPSKTNELTLNETPGKSVAGKPPTPKSSRKEISVPVTVEEHVLTSNSVETTVSQETRKMGIGSFNLIRPRDFANIKATKTGSEVKPLHVYVNVPRTLDDDSSSSSSSDGPEVSQLSVELTKPKGLADFKASVAEHGAGSKMDTLAVNRLLRQLEAAIAGGQHTRAATLARQLARHKVNCCVTRHRRTTDTDTITVDVLVEDRLSHQGPYPVQVSPSMTVAQLKAKVEDQFEIPAAVQRWILGKQLATDDRSTLQQHGVTQPHCPIFLYLVAPDTDSAKIVGSGAGRESEATVGAAQAPGHTEAEGAVGATPAQLSTTPAQLNATPAQPGVALAQPGGRGWYFNHEEDRYSYCETEISSKDASPEPASEAVTQPPRPPVVEAPAVTAAEEVEVEEEEEESEEEEAENDNTVGGAAGNTPLVAVVGTLTIGWKCGACTLINAPTRPGCLACGSDRPAEYRPDEAEASGAERRPQEEGAAQQVAADKKLDNYRELQLLENADLIPTTEPMECSVCLTECAAGEGAVLRDCLHAFCRACLAQTVQHTEEAEVRCPYRDDQYACDSTLQEREIKALVTPEVYEQHLAKSVAQAENKIGNAFHCKTPDCPGWCIFEDNVNTFQCPVCGQVNCLTCQAIHPGVDCKQHQEQARQEAETNADARRTREMLEEMVTRGEALPCPTCHVVLMKKWGCDWLRCSMCKTEICWVTRGPRWGPGGKGDTSAGCKCGVNGVKCHPKCNYCH